MEYGYETEIDLKALLFYFLYKWRSILVIAFAFCIFLSGVKIVSELMKSSDYVEELSPKARAYEIEKLEYEINMAAYQQNMTVYQGWLEQQEDYMENSILMKTDPYQKPVASADVFVKLSNEEWERLPDNLGLDPTDSIIKMYTSNFHSNIDWTAIEELTGQEARYLKELVTLSTDYNSNTFTISATYSDGETAQQIREVILKQVMDRYAHMSKDLGSHTLTFVNPSLTYVIDSELATRQKHNADTITEYKRTLLDYQKKLEDLKMAQPAEPLEIGFAKYPLVGFAAGGFLAVLFYGMFYFLGGKLHGNNELRSRYGYPLLGIIPETQKKGFLPGIDKFLLKLEDCSMAVTQEEAYERISRNMAKLAEDNKTLLLTGTVPLAKLQEIASSVTLWPENGISIVVAPNLNMDARSLKLLADCDAVILAEETGKSRIAQIQKELETIRNFKKPVTGYILF